MGKVFSKKLNLFLLIITLLLSTWFWQFFNKDILVATLGLLATIILATYHFRPKNKYKYILVTLFLLISAIQVKTVKFSEVYKMSAAQIDLQARRYNYYPPRFFRLGHILEIKEPVQIFYKVEQNFFDVLDIGFYFPSLFSYFSLPLVFYGLYLFVKKRVLFELGLIAYSLILIIIIGIHGDFGAFIVYPFITTFIFVSLTKLFKFKV